MSVKKENSPVPISQHGLIVRSSALASRGLTALQAWQTMPAVRQSRWLNFPEDRSVGTVHIGDEATFGLDEAQWEEESEEHDACGMIEVPFGKIGHLHLKTESLSFIKNIDPLALHGLSFSWEGSGITDEEMAHLKPLTSLTMLKIYKCEKITDTGLASLSALSSLTYLRIFNCNQITGIGLSHLKSLTKLALYFCPNINDEGLAGISLLCNLHTLRLWPVPGFEIINEEPIYIFDNVTDNGLAHLRSLTKLKLLSLRGFHQITDASLMHIASLTSLAELNISSDQFTEAAIAEFQQALPNCKVSR